MRYPGISRVWLKIDLLSRNSNLLSWPVLHFPWMMNILAMLRFLYHIQIQNYLLINNLSLPLQLEMIVSFSPLTWKMYLFYFINRFLCFLDADIIGSSDAGIPPSDVRFFLLVRWPSKWPFQWTSARCS